MKRSTDRHGPLFALAAVTLAAVACARTGVVEAPMMDASASASALALAGGKQAAASRPPDELDLPFRPGERWVGTYTCRQGKSEMSIVFEDVARASGDDDDEASVDVEATFEFHFAGSSSYAAADGAARMRGKFDRKTKRLRLVGEEWLEQPPNYALVNLVGTVTSRGGADRAPSYSGTVEGPGCTSFSASPEGAYRLLIDEKGVPRPQPTAPPRGLPRPGP